MENISFYRLFLLPVAIFFLTGCGKMSGEHAPGSQDSQGMTYVTFSLDVLPLTSGVDEPYYVSNMNVYAYRNGHLENALYSENPSKAGLYLDSGKRYSFYVLANTGPVEAPGDENSLRNIKRRIESQDSLDTGISPMSGYMEAVIDGNHSSLKLQLKRILARIGVRFDRGQFSKVKIMSVRVINIASDYTPFEADHTAEYFMEDAYDAPFGEVEALNSGNVIYVPVPENCQGSLFQGNTDPRRKSPVCLAVEENRCTYVEILAFCVTANNRYTIKEYLFCLGKDTLSDCNVERNTYTRVELMLNGPSLNDYTWKLSNDVSVQRKRFVAAGKSGKVVYTDIYGELNSTEVGTSSWNDIARSDDRYVMVGDNGMIACSEDCSSWKIAGIGYDVDWQAIEYSARKFVAVGYKYKPFERGGYYNGFVAVSENGIDWTVSVIYDYALRDIIYGDGKFVAYGISRQPGDMTVNGHIFLSNDAKSWIKNHDTEYCYSCIVYGNGMFAAMSSGFVSYSEDGITWSEPEDTGFSYLDAMDYGNGTYVAVGLSGNVIYSVGGLGWTQSDVSGNVLSDVFYGRGTFYVVGNSGLVMHSSDGDKWEKIDTGQDADLRCVCHMY